MVQRWKQRAHTRTMRYTDHISMQRNKTHIRGQRHIRTRSQSRHADKPPRSDDHTSVLYTGFKKDSAEPRVLKPREERALLKVPY